MRFARHARHTIGAAVGGAGLLASLAACGGDATPIMIGAAAPWHDADFSLVAHHGIELAVAEVNAAGGVRGRPLAIRWSDDSGNGTGAVAAAESLVADKRVVAVIGHMNSTPMLAAVPVYDGRIVAITPWATSPDLTGASRWVFRNTTSDSVNGVTIADFAAERLGARRASVLYENDAYGRGVARAFQHHFRGIVLSSDPIPATALSYEPYVSLLKQRRPDVVLLAGLLPSAVGILQEAKRQQMAGLFVSGSGLTGRPQDSATIDGTYVPIGFRSTDPRPSVQRFTSAYRARFHAAPDEDAATGYDATRMLAAAINAVGPRRAAIRDFLAAFTAGHPYTGVTGPVYFLPTGDPIGQPFQMGQILHGLPTIVPAR